MSNPVKSYYFALGYKAGVEAMRRAVAEDAEKANKNLSYFVAADDRVQKLPVPPMEEWPEDLE